MLTAPRRFAMAEARNRALKVLKAPAEISGFKYLMVWHPRVNTDAAHVWLRSTMTRIGKDIPS
jgi:DNA-binding transcriptional LysR family regulator